MYTKILDRLLFTVEVGGRVLGGSFFGIKEAFHTNIIVYEKSMVSTPGHKTLEVVIQPLLVRTCAIRITKHEVISILQQSVVTGREGVRMKGE